jgi:hypothetical protein
VDGEAVTCGASALASGALATQYLAFYYLESGPWWTVALIGVLAAASLGLAVQIGQGAAVGALAVSPLLGLLTTGFTVYALWNASFALYSLFAPPAAVLATVTAPLAIYACRRAEKAQAELKARYGGGPFGFA